MVKVHSRRSGTDLYHTFTSTFIAGKGGANVTFTTPLPRANLGVMRGENVSRAPMGAFLNHHFLPFVSSRNDASQIPHLGRRVEHSKKCSRTGRAGYDP